MPARLKAIVLLSLALLRTLVRLAFRSGRRGIAAFRRNYDADGLPPVTSAERERMPGFSRCIACGLCDRGEAQRIARSGGAYRGVMSLVLSASRSMPDYRAAAYSVSFISDAELAEKERICPVGVPMREIARFVRDKAAAVGGPLPLPPRIDSLPPRR
jgi:succinate dehydrogenase/fumarate reductase-like Fe-S protein